MSTRHSCSYCKGEMKDGFVDCCWDCYANRFPECDSATIAKVKMIYPEWVATPKPGKCDDAPIAALNELTYE